MNGTSRTCIHITMYIFIYIYIYVYTCELLLNYQQLAQSEEDMVKFDGLLKDTTKRKSIQS